MFSKRIPAPIQSKRAVLEFWFNKVQRIRIQAQTENDFNTRQRALILEIKIANRINQIYNFNNFLNKK
jgi:hypothetical protein